jgi:hypothetical protein
MSRSACPAWESGFVEDSSAEREGASEVQPNRFRSRIRLPGGAEGVVSDAVVDLSYRAARANGLDRALSAELAGHDPGTVVLGLAVILASGRGLPGGHRDAAGPRRGVRPVRPGPPISRLMHRLAADPDGVGALRRAAAAGWAGAAVARPAPAEVVVDIDGTLITAHYAERAPTGAGTRWRRRRTT